MSFLSETNKRPGVNDVMNRGRDNRDSSDSDSDTDSSYGVQHSDSQYSSSDDENHRTDYLSTDESDYRKKGSKTEKSSPKSSSSKKSEILKKDDSKRNKSDSKRSDSKSDSKKDLNFNSRAAVRSVMGVIKGSITMEDEEKKEETKKREDTSVNTRELVMHGIIDKKWKDNSQCRSFLPTYDALPSMSVKKTSFTTEKINVCFEFGGKPGSMSKSVGSCTIDKESINVVIRQCIAKRIINEHKNALVDNKEEISELESAIDHLFKKDPNYPIMIVGGRINGVHSEFPYDVSFAIQGVNRSVLTKGGVLNGWIVPKFYKNECFDQTLPAFDQCSLQEAYEVCGYSYAEYKEAVHDHTDRVTIPVNSALGGSLERLSKTLDIKPQKEKDTKRYRITREHATLVLDHLRKTLSRYSTVNNLTMNFSRPGGADWGTMSGITDGFIPESFKNASRSIRVECELEILIPNK